MDKKRVLEEWKFKKIVLKKSVKITENWGKQDINAKPMLYRKWSKQGGPRTDRKVVNKWKQKLAERKDTKNRENPDENSVKQWTLAKTIEEANVKFWNSRNTRMTQIRKHTKPRRKQTSNTWKNKREKDVSKQSHVTIAGTCICCQTKTSSLKSERIGIVSLKHKTKTWTWNLI